MAYLDQHTHSHQRVTAAVGVGAIHVVIAAGLALGLTIKNVIVDKDGPLEGYIVETELPPPPPKDDVEPDRVLHKPANPQVAPKPDVDLRTTPNEVYVAPPGPIVDDFVYVPTPGPVPKPGPIATPTVTPRFDPAPPVPRNGPIGWITNADYPSSSIRRLEEGTARYALSIGANGRVQDCRITSSTGSEKLDEATCKNLTRRARFDPAKGADGKAIASTYSGQVTWQIPN